MTQHYKDPDPQETQEWIESIEDALEEHGYERTRYLLETLIDYAQSKGARLPFNTSTPFVNTILPSQQPDYPGDRDIERKIKSVVRWNAMAMVTKANTESPGIGGHISTFASAATLYEVAFNHIFKGADHPKGQDLIFFQGHASPGMYARAYLEGRLTKNQLHNFRRELAETGGLSSYPHPYLMPDFWQFATVSMGLGPIMAIYQARFMRYMIDRGFIEETGRKVFAYLGDGEMDEPESMGALTLASRENLDNLVFVVNCNLQRLDGPVRGNSKVIQELESAFRGAGWNVIKVIWGEDWDEFLEGEYGDLLLQRLDEVVDGDLLKYVVEGGAYLREHFYGKYPKLLKMVEHLSDEKLAKLRLGGHDPKKVYAAYNEAVNYKGKPTVILARTIKGYGLGEAGEGRNITHNQKKLNQEELLYFRDRFNVPLSDEEAMTAPFYRFDENSEEYIYLKKHRDSLGGSLPIRTNKSASLEIPDISVFQELMAGTGDREISTTMAFVRLLTILTKDKTIGKQIVPIIPDEARTFGMDPLFRQLGIYAHKGQLYDPVDSDQFLFYKEAKNGQILEEGINEAGAISSFIAAGTSYSNHGIKMIPFYIYYSMFGFQRVWDFIWAAGDMRARGFLLGGTAGRTTLNGEGLQHQDGHSHLAAAATPNIKAYDLAYAYEIATVVHHGMKEMCEEDKDVVYYLTVENENYIHPPMPEGVSDDIIKGLYKIRSSEKPTLQLLGSGPLMGEVLAAATLLKNDWDIEPGIWNVTSFSELRRDAEEVERWNLIHPEAEPKKSHLETSLSNHHVPTVAVSDYVKMVSEQIGPYVPGAYYALGTDGYGRSETRENLRHFFEVDRYYIVLASIRALALDGKMKMSKADEVMKKYNINPEKPSPITV
ncbi:MAG: pyruvate dehydrogenase (acetyl-transferring), homodimeric type [Candidatus Marinimicrobia bacterium]|jgi:pyruvate dehydrogenase E1 component|nr:pyruvate dehydrogenase (acetyl-transferring), homodimeric type [Candidatus Neomarinimicrobiota bacterium]MBT3945404.1 pyruvate dehydrogenase (acetyl-transferring), homodimeric type [Candidatus Neomarinimicrobiota bacterium]MBT4155389.1 pyruvate dehydrogenase (acetyl-transferring), homodimeric type [Candidatus Neomarinimicrobiota bacterium]MBT4555579.1 pyruvate dehydrogenase (acetyl-transferring), homodimeric type [Candidatus Neomarinimicrobiota bacterium]MBT4752808.1 pyruvate dehydrogenase (